MMSGERCLKRDFVFGLTLEIQLLNMVNLGWFRFSVLAC